MRYASLLPGRYAILLMRHSPRIAGAGAPHTIALPVWRGQAPDHSAKLKASGPAFLKEHRIAGVQYLPV